MSEGRNPVPDLLATIVAATVQTVAVRRACVPIDELAGRVGQRPARPGAFRAALSRPDCVNIIAECKRRSPSRGVLRADYDAAAIAGGYERAGAAAVSVLTEPGFFDGALEHLRDVRARVDLPLLRKDFVVDPYQLWEAREAGADAVLLIVAALTAADLASLLAQAEAIGLDVLVEVHTPDELTTALEAGATIIGVNNRNLRTLEVDVRASEMIVGRKPAGIVAVSESGLKTADDIGRLRALGFDAFLIGERFMTELDPGAALRSLLAAVNGAAGHGQLAGGGPCS